jgi:tetratricopeptide (TPR) repeat protein
MDLWSKARAALKRLTAANPNDESGQACDHRNVPHQPGTPEFELFIAQGELKAGNLEHGAHHLAQLISYDPANLEWLDLLHEYLRRVGGDESKLWPVKEERYFAEEAVRAYSWAQKGQWKETFEHLIQVVRAKPDSAYLDEWGLNWLKRNEVLSAVPSSVIEYTLGLGLNKFPESRWLSKKRRSKLTRYAEVADRVAPNMHSSPTFPMLHAGLLRKLGRFDEAIAIARKATLSSPDWHSYVAEGLALRERADYEAAAHCFERALTFDPEDLSARLEAADGYLNNRVWDKAHDWYGQVLQRQPDHPWAVPSALYCRWKSTGDVLKHKRLVEMARRPPVNRRAAQLLRVNEPYVGVLPRPVDAIANVCRKVTQTLREKPPEKPGGNINLTVSHLESPSATLAFEEQLKALGHPMPVNVTVEEIPKPDPRIPCRPVKYALWTYTGTNAKPALPRPAQPILEAVSELASNPYERDENWKDAKLAAQSFSEEQIPQLLAVMANPPPTPKDKDSLEWIPRVQLAAAQIIANIGSGWKPSTRRDALLSALFGARDWINVAAIITLAHLAAENREIEADVDEAFKTLREFIPDGGYCCYEHALFACWQWLPSLTMEQKRSLHERLLDLEED